MNFETLRNMLAWCTVIDYILLLWWFLVFLLARDWLYRLHSRWFPMPVESFNAVHYAGLAFFKILILTFNLAPYLALRIVF